MRERIIFAASLPVTVVLTFLCEKITSKLLCGTDKSFIKAPIKPLRLLVFFLLCFISFAISSYRYGYYLPRYAVCALTLTLTALISVIDIYQKRVINGFIIAFFALSALFVLFDSYAFLSEHLFGFLLAFALSFAVYYLSKKAEKKEVFGKGDALFISAMGLFSGLWKFALAAMLACLLALGFSGVLRIAKKRSRGEGIAFTPFLSIGFAFSVLFGSEIINAYLSFAGKMIGG